MLKREKVEHRQVVMGAVLGHPSLAEHWWVPYACRLGLVLPDSRAVPGLGKAGPQYHFSVCVEVKEIMNPY